MDDEKISPADMPDIGDGLKSLVRTCLQHRLLTLEEERELGNIIQSGLATRNQIILDEDLLAQIGELIQFATPKTQAKTWFKSMRSTIRNLTPGDILQ